MDTQYENRFFCTKNFEIILRLLRLLDVVTSYVLENFDSLKLCRVDDLMV